jgi:hypothetical protein
VLAKAPPSRLLRKVVPHASLLHCAQMTSYPESQLREELVQLLRTLRPRVVLSWFLYPNLALLPSQGWGCVRGSDLCDYP